MVANIRRRDPTPTTTISQATTPLAARLSARVANSRPIPTGHDLLRTSMAHIGGLARPRTPLAKASHEYRVAFTALAKQAHKPAANTIIA